MPSPRQSTTAGLTSCPSMLCGSIGPMSLKNHFPPRAFNLAQKVRIPRVHQQIQAAVAVPIDRAELAASAHTPDAGVQPQRLAMLIAKNPLGRQEHQPAAAPGTLIEGQIALVVQHHQIGQPVAVPVDGDRRGPPLRKQLLALGTKPTIGERGRRAVPLDLNRLGGGQSWVPCGCRCSEPDNLAPDRVDDQIGQAVAVPVGHAERGVAPLRLARPLDAPVGPGHDADHPAVRLKILGAAHFGRSTPGPLRFSKNRM